MTDKKETSETRNDAIAKITEKPTIANFLNFPSTQKFLDANLADKRGEFVSNLIALCEADANLAACQPKDLMMCAMNATSLNLPLNKNLGFAYVIPYKGIPSFQIGYKGLIQLAIRTGAYRFINSCIIHEGELSRNKVTGEIKFIGDKPNTPVVGYMAYLELLTGFSASLYMTEEEIESHALRFSKMYQSDKRDNKRSSKWSDELARPKMALKTVLKGLLGTYGLMTTDMIKAMEVDNEEESGNSKRNVSDAEIISQDEPDIKSNEPKKVQI